MSTRMLDDSRRTQRLDILGAVASRRAAAGGARGKARAFRPASRGDRRLRRDVALITLANAATRSTHHPLVTCRGVVAAAAVTAGS